MASSQGWPVFLESKNTTAHATKQRPVRHKSQLPRLGLVKVSFRRNQGLRQRADHDGAA